MWWFTVCVYCETIAAIRLITPPSPLQLLFFCLVRTFSICVCSQSLSHVQLFATPWTVACQAPLSMGFFRQEYWSGLPFPPPGGLPNPGIEPVSLVSPVLAGRFFTTEPPEKPFQDLFSSNFQVNNTVLLLTVITLYVHPQNLLIL